MGRYYNKYRYDSLLKLYFPDYISYFSPWCIGRNTCWPPWCKGGFPNRGRIGWINGIYVVSLKGIIGGWVTNEGVPPIGLTIGLVKGEVFHCETMGVDGNISGVLILAIRGVIRCGWFYPRGGFVCSGKLYLGQGGFHWIDYVCIVSTWVSMSVFGTFHNKWWICVCLVSDDIF